MEDASLSVQRRVGSIGMDEIPVAGAEPT